MLPPPPSFKAFKAPRATTSSTSASVARGGEWYILELSLPAHRSPGLDAMEKGKRE